MQNAKKKTVETSHTVDGRNPANQLRLVVDPIIYRVLYIPGGCFGISEAPTVLSENEGVSFITSETQKVSQDPLGP